MPCKYRARNRCKGTSRGEYARTSQRIRRPYNEWRNDTVPYTTVHVEVPPFEPNTFAEAINCDAKADWAKSMQEEINSLVEQGTWKLVFPPRGAKIISSKWVYKIKTIDGKFERFKSRLVAKGFMQIQGVNYFETYAPVASLTTIRMITQPDVSNRLLSAVSNLGGKGKGEKG